MPGILVRTRMNPDQILPGSQDINVLLNTGKPPPFSRARVTNERIGRMAAHPVPSLNAPKLSELSFSASERGSSRMASTELSGENSYPTHRF
jgi:hypothetical protein